ncbi:hypothetical protein CesoFtcFv8_020586 [Champsocephalus esox]|uniref:Uncharacterized protein n=1 Tax=Champsocephalus esox TaxID=159716 RepID=A0AAN8BBF5_9TELE|nr:hypothetical protein CesoFtcFv8_020586 [Champsocephalus esox]
MRRMMLNHGAHFCLPVHTEEKRASSLLPDTLITDALESRHHRRPCLFKADNSSPSPPSRRAACVGERALSCTGAAALGTDWSSGAELSVR